MFKILFFAAAALCIGGACSKNYLDRQPHDKLSETDIYTNADLLEDYINSFYTVVPDPFTEGNISCITDEAFFRYGGTSTNYIERGLITPDTFMYQYENGYAHNTRTTFLNIWNRAYTGIHNMNEVLSRIDGLTFIPVEKRNQLKGETLFFRAWAYGNLIERFGGVPLISKVYNLGEEYNEKRATFDQCMDFILNDLHQAEDLLPAKAVDQGRVGSDVCLAFESRITLIAASKLFNDPANPTDNEFHGAYSEAKWTRALKASKAIVDRADVDGAYSLAKYEDIWKDTSCPEIIWAKFFSKTAGNKAQLFYAPDFFGGWTSCEPCEALVLDYEMAATGKKIFEEGSGYDPSKPWVGRDPRFYMSIIYPDCTFRDSVYANHVYYDAKGVRTAKGKFWRNESDDTGYNLRKWHIEGQPVSQSENNTIMFPWMRLAEMYLNYAECAYRTGDEATCRTYINKVRKRAGVNMPLVNDSGDALFDRLINERRVELAFETFRYFDLRRWKLADFYENVPAMGIVVAEVSGQGTQYRVAQLGGLTSKPDIGKAWVYSGNYKYTYRYRDKDYVIDYGYCHSMQGTQKHFTNKMYLCPIPQNEIIKGNGNLIQNPDY
jgi:hypothetical protein